MIKKLSKSELDEGLTLDMVNSIKMDRNYSPVQLLKGDEPCNILENSKGFWVMVDGKPLKDAENKMIVFTEKECRIGRARYLMNFAHIEKSTKIDALITAWRKDVRLRIDGIIQKRDFAHIEANPTGNDFSSILVRAILDQRTDEQREALQRDKKNEIDNLNALIENLESMWDTGNIIGLLEAFKIKQFSNPMLTAKFDDHDSMRILKNTFSADIITAPGWNITYAYAAIEIEKGYTM